MPLVVVRGEMNRSVKKRQNKLPGLASSRARDQSGALHMPTKKDPSRSAANVAFSEVPT